MKNVLIFGASGSLAQDVIDELKEQEDINLTLFLRRKKRLRNDDVSGCTIIEGDVLNYSVLKDAIEGQDFVYGNLTGNLARIIHE